MVAEERHELTQLALATAVAAAEAVVPPVGLTAVDTGRFDARAALVVAHATAAEGLVADLDEVALPLSAVPPLSDEFIAINTSATSTVPVITSHKGFQDREGARCDVVSGFDLGPLSR